VKTGFSVVRDRVLYGRLENQPKCDVDHIPQALARLNHHSSASQYRRAPTGERESP
jgi:hypothetical protein